MLLIAEIVLTIVAWQKGWRWFALIPLGIAVTIGAIVGGSGGNLESLIIFDILAIIALIIMLVIKKKPTEKVE